MQPSPLFYFPVPTPFSSNCPQRSTSAPLGPLGPVTTDLSFYSFKGNTHRVFFLSTSHI